MMLTSAEIAQKEIVGNSVESGRRPTTYDATVGCIIQGGQEVFCDSFLLPPRGIVWVVSAETFRLPSDTTGLATLRTTWTHNGILALNVGIVDPGWNGPLAAALVNFSDTKFLIERGEHFLRLIFDEHKIVDINPTHVNYAAYKKDIINKSRMFSESFLSMGKLADEVAERVFSVPKLVVYLTALGLILAAASIFVPIAFSSWSDNRTSISKLDVRLEAIDKEIKEFKEFKDKISMEARWREFEDRLGRAAGSATSNAVPSLPEPGSNSR